MRNRSLRASANIFSAKTWKLHQLLEKFQQKCNFRTPWMTSSLKIKAELCLIKLSTNSNYKIFKIPLKWFAKLHWNVTQLLLKKFSSLIQTKSKISLCMPAPTSRDLKSPRFSDLNEHLALDSNISVGATFFFWPTPKFHVKSHRNGNSMSWVSTWMARERKKAPKKFSTVNLFRWGRKSHC